MPTIVDNRIEVEIQIISEDVSLNTSDFDRTSAHQTRESYSP